MLAYLLLGEVNISRRRVERLHTVLGRMPPFPGHLAEDAAAFAANIPKADGTRPALLRIGEVYAGEKFRARGCRYETLAVCELVRGRNRRRRGPSRDYSCLTIYSAGRVVRAKDGRRVRAGLSEIRAKGKRLDCLRLEER